MQWKEIQRKKKTWVKARILFLLALTAPIALSLPSSADDSFKQTIGSEASLPTGTRLEGSMYAGGLQPDYVLDFDHPIFDDLREKMRTIRRSGKSIPDKAQLSVEYVKNMFVDRSYTGKPYLQLLEKYRQLKKPIPISEYAIQKVGVCREDALILHYALDKAGVPNEHYYIQIARSFRNSIPITEDHAFCVFEWNGKKWAADSNSPRYNGFALESLMSPDGINQHSLRLPFAEAHPDYQRRVLRINNYPKAWVPEKSTIRCYLDILSQLFMRRTS